MKKIKQLKHNSFLLSVTLGLLFGLAACSDVSENGTLNEDVTQGDSENTIGVTVSNVSLNTAKISITTTAIEGITLKGFVYSEKDANTYTEVLLDNSTGVTNELLSDLKAGTSYIVKGFADFIGTSEGVVWTEEVEFTTVTTESLYQLVFSDEFDTPGAPAAHWTPEIGLSIRNNEAQYYSDDLENAYVGDDGYLHIVAKKDHLGYNYTSASLHTRNSFVFMYGKMEVRAKIPVKGGSWPAIWMLGNWYDWPSNGEIDIMEYYSGKILANACWGSATAWQGVWDSSATSISHFTDQDADWIDKFHIWTIEWDYDQIILALDGEVLNTIELSETFNQGNNGNYENPFRAHASGFGHYVLLNLALGGNNGGTIDNTAFPMEYLIDYVRIYQTERLPE